MAKQQFLFGAKALAASFWPQSSLALGLILLPLASALSPRQISISPHTVSHFTSTASAQTQQSYSSSFSQIVLDGLSNLTATPVKVRAAKGRALENLSGPEPQGHVSGLTESSRFSVSGGSLSQISNDSLAGELAAALNQLELMPRPNPRHRRASDVTSHHAKETAALIDTHNSTSPPRTPRSTSRADQKTRPRNCGHRDEFGPSTHHNGTLDKAASSGTAGDVLVLISDEEDEVQTVDPQPVDPAEYHTSLSPMGNKNRHLQGITGRVMGKKNKAKFEQLARSERGLVLCRWCSKEVLPPRKTFCSEGCVHDYRLRSDNNYLRNCVLQRDQGVCSICKNNAHALYIAITSNQEGGAFGGDLEAVDLSDLPVSKGRVKRKVADKQTIMKVLNASHASGFVYSLDGSIPESVNAKKTKFKGMSTRTTVAQLELACARLSLHQFGLFQVLEKPLEDRLEVVWDLLKKQGFTAAYNNRENLKKIKAGHFWQADHVTAVAEGGGLCNLDNIRTLCTPCHNAETKELMKRLKPSPKKNAGETGANEQESISPTVADGSGKKNTPQQDVQ